MRNNNKTLIIFAAYLYENKIPSSLVYTLRYLSRSNDIILVLDNDISYELLNELSCFSIKTISRRHDEYDFGSYKLGIEYAYDKRIISKYSNLLITNDSIIGPLINIDNIFNDFSNRTDVDFYGLYENVNYNENKEGLEQHLQSYFILFKRSVFLNPEFLNFFMAVKKEDNKNDIVKKYEIGLTRKLVEIGFRYDSLFKSDKDYTVNIIGYVITLFYFPYIKKTLIKNSLLFRFLGKIIINKSKYNEEIKSIIIDNIDNVDKYAVLSSFIKKINKRFFYGK